MALEDEINNIVTGSENQDVVASYIRDAIQGVRRGFEIADFAVGEDEPLFEKVLLETLRFLYFGTPAPLSDED